MTRIAHWIDGPESGTALTSRSLIVTGWVHSPNDPVARVEIFVNDRLVGRAGLGRPRSDVALVLAAPDAELSGFELRAATPSLPADGVASIRVVATTLGGGRESLGTRDVWFRPLDDARPALESGQPRTSRFSRVPRRWGKRQQSANPIRVLWAARSLDTGGSQLRMAELVEHLYQEGGFHNTVLSPVEGPQRRPLEASDADVYVGGDFGLEDLAEYERDQSRLSSWMKGRFDLVIGFTVSSFPVIEAARRLGVPSILRIGEAEPLSTVLSWIAVPIAPAVEGRAQRAFANASVLMSNSYAAVESYRADGFDGNFVVVGTGVDVAGASDYANSSDRLATRRRLGIRTNERLLFCGASLWPIKGQALLVEAIDQLHQKYPELTCVLMGGADTDYADAIRSFVSRHGLAEVVRILPFKADLRQWWVAADVAVCTSESESLPAAVLEAMAFGLPVLSCSVGDVPLFVEDGISGWLVDHSDLEALVSGLESVATTSPERLRMMGQAATRSAARHFDSTVIFDRITNLLRTTANGVTAG